MLLTRAMIAPDDEAPKRTGQRRRLWLLVAVAAVLAVAAAVLVMRITMSSSNAPQQSASFNLAPPLPVVDEVKLRVVTVEAAQEINSQRGFDVTRFPAARPFVFQGSPDARARAIDCLAAAAVYEAGSDVGMQKSVVQVVLNRARHPAFRASVCETVFQGSQRLTGCQFTFTCDGSLRRVPSAPAWERARALAASAIAGEVDARVGYATHYHADYVVPYWASSLDKMSKVGVHIFYRWKGYWGKPGAFSRGVGGEEPAYGALAKLSPAHATPDALPPPPSMTEGDGAPALVPPPLAAPIAVEGVREKSLRGAVVRGQATDSNHFFLQLDPTTFPGNYATAAVALCRGKPSCTVMGWRDPAAMGGAMPLSSPQRDAMTFYFRQRENAVDIALWNCAQIARRNAAQCLPGTIAGLGTEKSPVPVAPLPQ